MCKEKWDVGVNGMPTVYRSLASKTKYNNKQLMQWSFADFPCSVIIIICFK